MKTSISDDNIYPNFCELAANDDSIFNTFRMNPNYTSILEHVSFEQGNIYTELINKNNPELWGNVKKYMLNDNVGSPRKMLFNGNYISPTTVRYIKVLGDIKNQFGDLNGLDIVEIGCGYGGQAKIIMDTFDVKSYTLIDLPSVLKLTKKFLTKCGDNLDKVFFKTMNELTTEKNYDLFISNYAYTECTKAVQLEYYDKVLSKSKMGYMTANFINTIFNLDYLTKEELFEMFPNHSIVDEVPQTHPNNFILIWK
jgi:putative sugar O-methyltransferase